MKKILNYFLLTFFLVNCSAKRIEQDYSNLSTYKNDNLTTINIDSQKIYDKVFTLKLPANFKNKKTIVDDCFRHEFEFESNQKIVILFNPFINGELNNNKKFDLDYNEFKNLIKTERLEEKLNSIKLNNKRYFGFRLLYNNFYVMYINVKSENLNSYNFCINSLQIVN